MDAGTLDLFEWKRNNDYTGSVCWLFWNKKRKAFDTREALIDAEDFERLKHDSWRINLIGKKRKPRVVRNERKRLVYLARQLLDEPTGKIVDHENRNSLDDRRFNLRVCTVGENNLNRAQTASARSQFKGVAWNPSTQKWQVYTGRRGNRVLLGHFDCEIKAAQIYNEFARTHYGPMAYLNPV